MGLFSGIPIVGDVVNAGTGVIKGIGNTFNPKIPGVDEYNPDPNAYKFDRSGFDQRFANATNQAGSQQTLDYRNQLFGDLRARVAGEKPSVAEQQFAQSLDQLRAQQASQAASQGAYNPAAQRAAAYNTAQIGQQGAGQAAVLRAGEQATAEQLFANALNQARGQDISQNLGYEQLGLGYAQGGAQAAQAFDEANLRRYLAQLGAQQDAYKRQTAGVGALLGAGGAAAAGPVAASDINLKMDIRSGDDSVEEFLNELSAYEYKYKKGDGKDKLGVMAQDLEKSRLGKQMVFNTKEGKMVDYGQGFGAMMSAIAYLNDKVKKIEGA